MRRSPLLGAHLGEMVLPFWEKRASRCHYPPAPFSKGLEIPTEMANLDTDFLLCLTPGSMPLRVGVTVLLGQTCINPSMQDPPPEDQHHP